MRDRWVERSNGGVVSFVVPAHNERGCIVRTVRAIQESAREAGLEHEVIVVDDASTDGTGEIARDIGVWGCARILVAPTKMVTQRKPVENIWYDSNREDDETLPNSVWVRISNGLALVLILVLVTGPLWNFVPRSMTPIASVLGKIRFACAVVLSHAGLLFLPIAIVLFWNLVRQKRWAGTIQSLILIGLCTWQGMVCGRGVGRVWRQIGAWTAWWLN